VAQTQVFGVRETLAEIKSIDKKLYFASVQNIKDATKPLQAAIVSEFAMGSPLSGMEHRGRTGWKTPKVTPKFGGRKDKTVDEWGLVKIIFSSASGQIVDMAGRAHSGGKTREYQYKGKKRSHAINGQARGMLNQLGGSPSRYIWPTADMFRPMTNRAVLKAIEEVSRIVNKNLVVRKP
jgi:hypothetical protein